jgi:hypothetical protein
MRNKLSARLATAWLFVLATACGGSPAGSPGDGAALPTCTSTVDGAAAMSPATFCQIFVASCPLTIDGYTGMADCLASYTALTTTKPNKQRCQSYHLCQAVAFPAGANRDNHCGHATGFPGNQACEQLD